MTNSILYGNGFNYSIPGFPSWSQLISSGAMSIDSRDIPFTIQHEIVLEEDMSGDDIMLLDGNKKKKIQDDLKEKVKNIVNDYMSGTFSLGMDLYKRVADMNVENFLTTNYDNIMYRYLRALRYTYSEMNRTEDVYSIRRYYRMVKKGSSEKFLWNIHGDVENYISMMVGYNHYCGSIGKMNAYLKGQYEYETSGGKDKITLAPIKKRLLDGLEYNPNAKVKSWIDLFFTTNVHIVGLGLPFDEIDLWWLLNYRARLSHEIKFKHTFNNKVYYYCWDINSYKKRALESFGVTVFSIPIEDVIKDADGNIQNLKDLYYRIFDELERNISL